MIILPIIQILIPTFLWVIDCILTLKAFLLVFYISFKHCLQNQLKKLFKIFEHNRTEKVDYEYRKFCAILCKLKYLFSYVFMNTYTHAIYEVFIWGWISFMIIIYTLFFKCIAYSMHFLSLLILKKHIRFYVIF